MKTDCSPARFGLGLFFALAAAAAAFAQTAPVVIITQPADRSVTVGTAATFTVAATGNPAPTYQWRKNGANIATATGASYAIPNTALGDNGSLFSVVVTNSSGPVTSQNARLTVNSPVIVDDRGPGGVPAGQTATFTIVANGGTPPYTYQWYRLKNGVPPLELIPGATSAIYTTPPTTVAGDNGNIYSIKIKDASGVTSTSPGEPLTVFQAAQSIKFPAPINPVVSPSPIALSATADSGLAVTYSVLPGGPATVSGSNLTLTGVGNVTVRASQAGNSDYLPAPNVDVPFNVAKGAPVITWTPPNSVVDGTMLGATHLNATANVPGTFVYSPASGAVVHIPSQILNVTFTPSSTVNYNVASEQRTLPVTSAVELAHLVNVSVRTTLPGAQILFVGFTMQGGSKPVVLRAVGPGLTQFQVPGVMSDPKMALFKGTAQLDANDNWGGSSTISNAFASVGAFPLPPTSLDSALLRSVDGGHSAQITGPAGTVLVEVYDAGAGPSPHLTNVSARNRAGVGSEILIAGFIIAGSGDRNLLIRAVGPGLTAFNIPGFLVDPKLEVFSGGTGIANNDTWNPTLASTFASVGAFPLTAGSKDAALIVNLRAGMYSVQVSGADGGTGEALIEVYELP